MAKRRWWRFGLGGLTGRRQLQLLAAQLATVHDGLSVVRALTAGELALDEARKKMGVVEHEGDDDRARLVDTLAVSLVTPIDREDVFRLSRSIDDVLDELRDFVREADMFGAEELQSFTALLDGIGEGIGAIERAVDNVEKSGKAAAREVLAARKAGNRVRRGYQRRVVRLLSGDPAKAVTAGELRELELLRTIDRVVRHLGAAADALADGVMKRWH
ncbi:DUF47 domain-containing protein [Bailinhaonella thermotolerans]|uniref:DUF47 domain-containing protein n=1 Tax=Bailinhaonella thermotolerans TaxID=1070861 RepID=UPI00192A3A02|nr:DUF47 family protein [Bailinhaonella thermotolerans]